MSSSKARCAIVPWDIELQSFDTTVIAQLTQSQVEVDALIERTRSATQEHLHTAQELSLLRHSLADELSFLSQELVSSLSGPESRPTLLEDIETLHRNLKELNSVKAYIQVIAQALQFKYALFSLSPSCAQSLNHCPQGIGSDMRPILSFCV